MPIEIPTRRFTFETVDYLSIAKTTLAAPASGVVDAVFDSVDAPLYWQVERIVVTATTGTPALFIYVGEPTPANLRDATLAGLFDVADESQPIVVQPGLYLRARWIFMTVGATGTCTLQVRVVEKVPV